MLKDMMSRRFQIFSCFVKAAKKQRENNKNNLALCIDCRGNHFSAIECDKKNPFPDLMKKIRKKLDTSVDFFFLESLHSLKPCFRE